MVDDHTELCDCPTGRDFSSCMHPILLSGQRAARGKGLPIGEDVASTSGLKREIRDRAESCAFLRPYPW